jgi:hypothetical protein
VNHRGHSAQRPALGFAQHAPLTAPLRAAIVSSVSLPDYEPGLARTRPRIQLAADRGACFNLVDTTDPEQFDGLNVDPDFVTVSGQATGFAAATLTAEDARSDAQSVVLISERLWQRRFAATADMAPRDPAARHRPDGIGVASAVHLPASACRCVGALVGATFGCEAGSDPVVRQLCKFPPAP